MRVVVTRPGPEAERWSQALRERGHQVLQLPLLQIAPVPDPGAAARAGEQLAQYAAAMFVSANAVRHFRAVATQPWPATTRAWATGPGTARALREAGVPDALLDTPPGDAAQFESETLWQQVQAQARAGTRVLVVRGADGSGQAAGRPWLAERLQAAGVQVDTVAVYLRQPPAWSEAQRAMARAAAADGAIWLLSSSEAVAHLRAQLPDTGWSRARAIATHERMAQAARDAGFGVVWLSRPDLGSVAAALESIQ